MFQSLWCLAPGIRDSWKMNDDMRLLQHLHSIPQEEWERLFSAVDSMQDSDWEVTAGGGTLTASGTIATPYPIYSPSVTEILEFLNQYVTVPFDWVEWIETHSHMRKPESIPSAEPADMIRVVTALIRSERFSEGTIASAITSGLLRAILERLRLWHLTGQ